MSSVGQAIGGLVGGVIGFFTPVGALYGAQIGMMLGGVLDPPKTQGPRLEDLTAQTSTYGAFIPRLYGMAPVAGNVFWIQGDKLIEHSVESDGKGGPTVTSFEYFATFAVGLCEGPIDGVRRIWIGGQLWYDAGAADIGSVMASNENASGFTLYRGTDTQLADPLIQADRGAANVPAYRGLAYIVFDELPLKNYGNSLAGAQVKVEIVTSGTNAASFVERVAIPASTAWHGSYGAAGNQYDAQGMSNFVASLTDSPWTPQWVRSIGGFTTITTLPGDGNVDGVQNSLNTLQYCYGRLDRRYVVWGDSGRLVPEYDCGSGWKVSAFAEGGGFAYAIKQPTVGSDYTLIRLPFNDRISATLVINGAMSRMLSTWNGDAIVFDRTSASGAPLVVEVYRETYGVISLIDTLSIDLGESAYLMNSAYSAGHVVGDTLTLVSQLSSASATIIQVDLLTETVIKKAVVTAQMTGITTPLNASVQVVGDMVIFGQRSTGTDRFLKNTWNMVGMTANPVALSTIVEAECLQSSLLTAGDLDVTELTDQVRGYRISNMAPVRGGLDQLRKAWPFDAIQHGYKIKFKKRGGASVATITEAELDARAAGASPGVRISNVREMDLIMPQQLTLQYMDAAREYDANIAEESR